MYSSKGGDATSISRKSSNNSSTGDSKTSNNTTSSGSNRIAISLLTCQRVTKPENTELPSPDTLTRPRVHKYLERYVHERRAFQSPVTQPAVQ